MGKGKIYVEETHGNNLGPIFGHSLNGDSKRRQLMLKDYSSKSRI